LRNLGHHVEGVLGGGPACAEFQRARVDDLTSSLPMKDGQPVKRGCWGGEHPAARGSRRRWGVARRSPSLVLQSGGGASSGAPCRSTREAPSGLLRLAPAGLRVVCGAGERGRAPPRSRCPAPFFSNLARGRPSSDPAAVWFGAPLPSFGASASEASGATACPRLLRSLFAPSDLIRDPPLLKRRSSTRTRVGRAYRVTPSLTAWAGLNGIVLRKDRKVRPIRSEISSCRKSMAPLWSRCGPKKRARTDLPAKAEGRHFKKASGAGW
jgi:hypothetical protein